MTTDQIREQVAEWVGLGKWEWRDGMGGRMSNGHLFTVTDPDVLEVYDVWSKAIIRADASDVALDMSDDATLGALYLQMLEAAE